jgi:arginase
LPAGNRAGKIGATTSAARSHRPGRRTFRSRGRWRGRIRGERPVAACTALIRRVHEDGRAQEWRGPDLNRRHRGFQPRALPAELPRRGSDSVPAPGARPGEVAAYRVLVARRGVAIVGAPLDLGAGGRRGVDMGPSAIRYAGLGERIESLGLVCRDRANVDAPLRETADAGDPRARFLTAIRETCERVAVRVADAVREGSTPLVLGGDHSIALGTLGGLASVRGAGGVIWLDAHGDLNTPETTPSGNVHGMPLAAALGRGGAGFLSDAWSLPSVDPARVALVGTRSLDPGERELARGLGLAVFTMSEIDRRGLEAVVRDALAVVSGAAFVHVSLDMDVVDPGVAPGVGTPVRGGLSYREAHLAMELVAEAGVLGSLEIVEVNPILDHENQTARLAVELAASALGARIL